MKHNVTAYDTHTLTHQVNLS